MTNHAKTIFYIDPISADASGEVEDFCSTDCYNERLAEIDTDETPITSVFQEDRSMMHDVHCHHCGDQITDPVSGTTSLDLINFIENYVFDELYITILGDNGVQVEIQDSVIFLDVARNPMHTNKWKPADPEKGAFIEHSSSLKELLLTASCESTISIGGAYGFSAQIKGQLLMIMPFGYKREE